MSTEGPMPSPEEKHIPTVSTHRRVDLHDDYHEHTEAIGILKKNGGADSVIETLEDVRRKHKIMDPSRMAEYKADFVETPTEEEITSFVESMLKEGVESEDVTEQKSEMIKKIVVEGYNNWKNHHAPEDLDSNQLQNFYSEVASAINVLKMSQPDREMDEILSDLDYYAGDFGKYLRGTK